ncbi:MAG: DMT family transporter [Candidatus Omnitrophota bacterium]
MTPNHNARGIFLMAGASLSFALMASAIKSVSRSFSAPEIVFIRSALGLIFIAGLMAKTRAPWIGREPRFLVARGVVGFTAMVLYFWAISQIDLGTAMMLNYTSPIFAFILAHLLFRERSTALIKAALFLSFIGVYLLTAPQLAAKPLPLLVALFSGMLVGVVHVLIRYSHAEEAPLTIIFYFTTISVLGSGLLLVKTGFAAPLAGEWPGLLAVTATSMLGQLGLTYSLRSAPVSVVSPFAYLTPVFGLFLGGWFWKEPLPAMSLAGSVLIILCGMIAYKYQAD